MKLHEVQFSIERNLARLVEESPTEELRLLAEEVAADLKSTEHIHMISKYKLRGRNMNLLAVRNHRIERENRILSARMEAIRNLTFPPAQ